MESPPPQTELFDGTRFEVLGHRVRFASYWLAVPAASAAAGGLMLAMGSVLGAAMQFITATALGIIIVNKPRRLTAAAIRVDAQGIAFNGEVLARLDEVTGLSVARSPVGWRVSIMIREKPPLDLQLSSETHVAELRHALGLALARSAARRFVGHTALGGLGAVASVLLAISALFVVGTMLGAGPLFLLFPFILIMSPLALAALRGIVVTCGEEGVHIQRRVGSTHLPYSDVTVHETSIQNVVELRGPYKRWNVELGSAEDAHMMIGDIRRRALVPAPPGDENIGALLARSGRSVAQWLSGVRVQAKPEAAVGYRAANLDQDRLFNVLEDPSADPTARIAAAVALRVKNGDDDELVRRVRIAATSTAYPEMRQALSEIIDAPSDDEAIERVARIMK